MADRNRNRSRNTNEENWNKGQERFGRENDHNQRHDFYGNVNYDRENEDYRSRNYGDRYGSSGYGGSERRTSSNDRESDWQQPYYGSPYGSKYIGESSGNKEHEWDNQWRRNMSHWRDQYDRGDDMGHGYGRRYGTGNTAFGSERFHDDYYRQRIGNSGRNYPGRGDYNEPQGLERNWWDRTRDEVSSWFGDEEAERRRRMDESMNGPYKGRGPKGYQRSDQRIMEDVCDRLSDHPALDASNIDIKVEGSEVVLTGTVNTREDKRRAEDLAESISGVTNVQNQLRVTHRGSERESGTLM